MLLQRTAEATVNAPDKYLRLGVDGPEELPNGFPLTREELFAYRGIILGSVEASAFTPEQQRMLEDFVDVRGGGLLALGGDAVVLRRRLGRHAAGRRAAGRARSADRAARSIRRPSSVVQPDARRRESSVDADRRQGRRRARRSGAICRR